MEKVILGKKIGMTQIFDENGRAIPVTVVEAGPCRVVQKKTAEKDGYKAIQLGFEEISEKKLNKPQQGHFTRANVSSFRYLKEFRVNDPGEYAIGQELKADIFEQNELVDVTGLTKGKGFAGGIKRHGFQRGPMAHGSKYHRRPGSLAAKGPARVFKGRKLPGRMGASRVTVKNLKVKGVDASKNILLIQGALPGPQKSLLLFKASSRAKVKE